MTKVLPAEFQSGSVAYVPHSHIGHDHNTHGSYLLEATTMIDTLSIAVKYAIPPSEPNSYFSVPLQFSATLVSDLSNYYLESTNGKYGVSFTRDATSIRFNANIDEFAAHGSVGLVGLALSVAYSSTPLKAIHLEAVHFVSQGIVVYSTAHTG